MKWKRIKSAPKDGTKVDLWLHIHRSLLNFADSFRVIDCWFEKGRWVHHHEGKVAELGQDFITHWMPIALPPEAKP